MISPSTSILFSVGGFSVHFYGVIMFFAIMTALFVMRYMAKKYYPNVDTEILLDILPVVLVFAILGARFYYVVMDFGYYSKHLNEIIAIWHGGLSIHGAIIGGVLSGLFMAKIKHISFLKYADVFAYGLTLGQAVGRFGNYFNCEAFGAPCNIPYLKLFIPVDFRPLGYENVAYFHPTFLYESLWDMAIFFILFLFVRKIKGTNCGTIFFAYLLLYSIGRFFIENIRLDSVLNVLGIPIAQIVSIIIIIIALVGLFLVNRAKQTN